MQDSKISGIKIVITFFLGISLDNTELRIDVSENSVSIIWIDVISILIKETEGIPECLVLKSTFTRRTGQQISVKQIRYSCAMLKTREVST
jgi:hypothetical protein